MPPSHSTGASCLNQATRVSPAACLNEQAQSFPYRYRCPHVAWNQTDVARNSASAALDADAIITQNVAIGSARLEKLDLVCEHLAALNPLSSTFGQHPLITMQALKWAIQVHLCVLAAAFEIRRLLQHSAWQLLHPSSHVLKTCESVSGRVCKVLKTYLLYCEASSCAARDQDLIRSSLELVLSLRLHCTDIQSETLRASGGRSEFPIPKLTFGGHFERRRACNSSALPFETKLLQKLYPPSYARERLQNPALITR